MAKPKRKWKSPPRYKAGPKKGQFKPKAKKNPRKRRRNPEAAAPAAKTNPRRRRRVKRRRNPTPTPVLLTTVQAAAAPKKRKTKKKAAKKTASKRKPRTGGKTVAKRKKAKKAAKKTKRPAKRTRKTGAKKSKQTAKQRAASKRNIKKAQAANRRKGGKRRKTRSVSVGSKVRGRVRKGAKARTYRVVARKGKPNKKGRRRISLGLKRVKRNPMAAFKSMAKTGLMVFGGVMGMRVINNLLNKYVISRFSGSMPAQIVPILPALGGFVFAGFAGKFIKKPALLQAVQMGATLALFEAAFNSFVKPHLPAQVSGLLGVDDMGFRGYGRTLGEYVAQPAQLGATAYEAMALDEYIPGNAGVGAFDVSEALADNEVEAFQRGYAGGSLSKTSLGS